VVQVVLDRARADEQLGADLRVGVPVAGQPRNLDLLRRQGVAPFGGDPARGSSLSGLDTVARICDRDEP
jgi:hypothetical protein